MTIKKTDLFIFIVFLFLGTKTFIFSTDRKSFLKRSAQDYFLDIIGLIFQGIGVPLLQIGLFWWALDTFFPHFKGALKLNFLESFIINFFIIDYIYYWNHRLLHKNWFWHLHKVHHSTENLDFLASSRNSIYTPFFIIYLYGNGALLFLLEDNLGLVWGIALSSGLDLWRHTKFSLPKHLRFFWRECLFLNDPIDHFHHHDSTGSSNFGANLNLFDKIHGTYFKSEEFPEKTGIPLKLTFWEKLLLPFKKSES